MDGTLESLRKMSTEELISIRDSLNTEIGQLALAQTADKTLMNALYGATSNKYFAPYFDLRVAESITSTGQTAIRFISDKINVYLNNILKTEDVDYVCANDTDSAYVILGPLVEKLGMVGKPEQEIVEALDKICKQKIDPYIDKCYRELAETLNAHEHMLFMKREKISRRAIWCAAKRYAVHVWDSEGVRYESPEVEYTGLDAKRSNIPERFRNWLEDCYGFALNEDEAGLREFVVKCKEDYNALSPEELAYVSTANNLIKNTTENFGYAKGTLEHIKGCINYNKLASQDKSKSLKPIMEGEKVKVVKLKKNKNKYGFESISFTEFFPRGYGLEESIDYDEMLKKGFINPLQNFLDAIDWQAEVVDSLDDFFS